MKNLTPKTGLLVTTAWLAGVFASSHAQVILPEPLPPSSLTLYLCGTDIFYSSGPSQTFHYEPSEISEGSLDLNKDGAPDFSFHLPYFLCTTDVPTSACNGPYIAVPLGTNAVLSQSAGLAATLLSFGNQVGGSSPGSSWRTNYSLVANHYISERYRTNVVLGPLAEVGVGYLGVRFYAADGLHYGWVRLRLAPFISVVDWAYEGRPNLPICAGMIGSKTDSMQFRVNFGTQYGIASGNSGTFILTGNTLRGELTLAGGFSSATIAGPAPPHARGKPLGDLGDPLVARTNFTSFLGDIALSEGEIKRLLRDVLYVSVDGGILTGRIERLQ